MRRPLSLVLSVRRSDERAELAPRNRDLRRSAVLFVLVAFATLAVACPAPEPRDEPPEGVVIEVEPGVEAPPENDNELNEEPLPPEDPAPPEPPPELDPRPVRLRERPEVVDAGWRVLRRFAPDTNAVQTTLANPAYVAGLFAHAAVGEDAALLRGVLHPEAALDYPADFRRVARGESPQEPEAWRAFWWRLRTQVYGAQAVLQWGGPRPRSPDGAGGASVAVVLAPREPAHEPLLTVLLLGTREAGDRGGARAADSPAPGEADNPAANGGAPTRWAVVDVQTHLRADALALATPAVARFEPQRPQPQLFPVDLPRELAQLDRAEHAAQLDSQMRELARKVAATDAQILPALADVLAVGLGFGPPPDESETVATLLERELEQPETLLLRTHTALADAPELTGQRLLRLYRGWHPETDSLVADLAVVLEAPFGFPRLYRARWVALDFPRAAAEAPANPGNPWEREALPLWRLVVWEPWLSDEDPRELLREEHPTEEGAANEDAE